MKTEASSQTLPWEPIPKEGENREGAGGREGKKSRMEKRLEGAKNWKGFSGNHLI